MTDSSTEFLRNDSGAGQLDLVLAADLTTRDDHLRQKAVITDRLIAIGSILLHTYADPATDYDPFEPKKVKTASSEDVPVSKEANVVSPVAKLNKAALKAFGVVGDYIQYDYSEEFGPLRKRCILEVSRADGAKRVYSTKPEFARKSEAKINAASIAIEHGAMEFILHGDQPKGKGYALTPVNLPRESLVDDATDATDAPKLPALDIPNGAASSDSELPDPAIAEIDRCCKEWRAGRVKPAYYFTLTSNSSDHGCGLKLSLSEHVSRTYSVFPSFKSTKEAQDAAAALAIRQGVIDFIQRGDGQQEPLPASTEYDLPQNLVAAAAVATTLDSEQLSGTKRKRAHQHKLDQGLLASKIMSVANFFDSLPQPLPEPVGVKGAEDTNPVAYLHGTIKKDRASNLSIMFAWTSDAKFGLHGCVARIQQGSSTDVNRSYLVDPVFAKRQDARVAVCLEAISGGVCQWIRSLEVKLEAELSQVKKEEATQVLARLSADMQRMKPPQKAKWNFSQKGQAFGSSLTVCLDTDSFVSRTYSVPAGYRSRNDAKMAVVLAALDEGVLEFVRFRGAQPPAGYDRDTYEAKRQANPQPRPQRNAASSTINARVVSNESRKRKYAGVDYGRSVAVRKGVYERAVSGVFPDPGVDPRREYYGHGQGVYREGDWTPRVGGHLNPQFIRGHMEPQNEFRTALSPPIHPSTPSFGLELSGSIATSLPDDLQRHYYSYRDHQDYQTHDYYHQTVEPRAYNQPYGHGEPQTRPRHYPDRDIAPPDAFSDTLEYYGEPGYENQRHGVPHSRVPGTSSIYRDPSSQPIQGQRYGPIARPQTATALYTSPDTPTSTAINHSRLPPPLSASSHVSVARSSALANVARPSGVPTAPRAYFGHINDVPPSLSSPLVRVATKESPVQPQDVVSAPRSQSQHFKHPNPGKSIVNNRAHFPTPAPIQQPQKLQHAPEMSRESEWQRSHGFAPRSSGPSPPTGPKSRENALRPDLIGSAKHYTPTNMVGLPSTSASIPQKLNFAKLVEYCQANNQPIPQLHSEAHPSPADPKKYQYKIWIIIGQSKYELPKVFDSTAVGEETLAKQVLANLMTTSNLAEK